MSMEIGRKVTVETPHETSTPALKSPAPQAPVPAAAPSPRGASRAPARPGDGFEAGRPVRAHFDEHVDKHAKGAYFRKVESPASSKNEGIRGVGTLPQVQFDPTRQFKGTGATAWQTGPLERPSVYMGGRSAGKEVDCGLSWDRVYDSKGRATYTDNANGSDMRDPAHRFARVNIDGQPALVDGNDKVVAKGQAEVDAKMKGLRENFAFRPFWRDTNSDTPKEQRWHNAKVGTPENMYFYPGERFTMSVKESGPERIRMDIRLEDAKHPQHFTTHFRQEGFGAGQAASFKRVNSVDQFVIKDGKRIGAETTGQVEATRTTALGASWDQVSLLRADGQHQPMMGPDFSVVKGADTAKRYGTIFRISGSNEQGGERIDIHPAGR
jgi:hypothetical protein